MIEVGKPAIYTMREHRHTKKQQKVYTRIVETPVPCTVLSIKGLFAKVQFTKPSGTKIEMSVLIRKLSATIK